jgi:hypothetical protein
VDELEPASPPGLEDALDSPGCAGAEDDDDDPEVCAGKALGTGEHTGGTFSLHGAGGRAGTGGYGGYGGNAGYGGNGG